MDVLNKKICVVTVAVIVVLCMAITALIGDINFDRSDKANALVDSSKAKYVGELTITGDAEGKGGKVFDGGKLNELYRLLLGDSATYATVQAAASQTRSTPAGGVGGLTVGKNAAEFSNNVVVKIGGINWIATVLTVDKTGDVVLTLWRENIPNDAAHKAAFSQWPASSSSGSSMGHTYPGNVYGTSYVRSILLNGRAMTDEDGNDVVVEYSTSASVKTVLAPNSIAQTANYEYDLFTNTDYDNNLTDYIVKPTKIAYQETQDRYACSNNSSTVNSCPNECYGTPVNGFVWNTAGTTILNGIQNKYAYNDWQYDYIWLPSAVEISGNNSMWGCTKDIKKDNVAIWSRSGAMSSTNRIDHLNQNGDGTTSYVNDDHGIRPAFHLNLTKAQQAAAVGIPEQDDTVKKYYNSGSNLDFKLHNIDTEKMDITDIAFTPVKGESVTGTMTQSIVNGVANLTAGVAGKYTVKCQPKSGQVWTDGSTSVKEYQFKIVYQVAELSFVGQTSLTYNGAEQEFKFGANFDDQKISVAPITAGLSFDDTIGTKGGLKAKTFGEYSASTELKDKDLMEWITGGTDDKTVKVQISKRPLTLSFVPSNSWSWANGEEKQVGITDNRCNDDENLVFNFTYVKTGSADTPTGLLGAPDAATPKTTNVTIPALNNGNYTFAVTLTDNGDGKNYEISGTSTRPFSITDKAIVLTESDIIWQYQNVNLDDGNIQNVGAWDNTTVVEVYYTGAEYTFGIDERALSALGVKLSEYKNQTYKDCGTNYSTSVTLAPLGAGSTLNGGNSVTFTIKWKILQGRYDLSKVYWDYSPGTKQYNGDLQKVELINPYSNTLKPSLRGNTGTEVKSDYKAIISAFSNSDPNFINPDKNDPSTYIYVDGEEFPWELTWSIDKARLNLIWEEYSAKDKNGRTYTDYKVEAANSDKIEKYVYYTDNNNDLGDPIAREDIEVIPGEERYYWIVAVLKSNFDGNYEIASGEKQPMTVGSNKNEIMVSIKQNVFLYDGECHGESELSVTSGSIDINRIIKTYYKDEVSEENKLEGAPKDAGKYIIVLSLSSSDAETKYLGADRIEFEIEKVKITAKWDTEGQTPIISGLNDELKEVVEYIYFDSDGNKLEDGAQLEAGKTYKIQAVLKDGCEGNYEFVAEDGETVLENPTATGEMEFKVEEKKPNGGGNLGGLGNAEDLINALNGLPLWQLIAGGASIVLIIIFMSKGIDYDSKRRKAKKVTENKYKTFYAAAGLWGLSNTNWTIIACTLMGAAVLSLVFMIIEKSRYDKAKDLMDEAKDEYERKRRDEEMRMLFMHMGGGNGNMNGGMAQGAYMGVGIGADEIRGIISDTVTALLPGMQQMLPQTASVSDNDEVIKKLVEGQDMLMRKFAEQQPVEKVIEREVAGASVDSETIKQMMKNQETLMQKIIELSAEKKVETQVVEKIVEKPVEKIVEKEVRVEVPVEKIVEKEVVKEVKVEVPVEKIVEVPVEVEKIVEKVVAIAAASKAKKEVAPRLTLDEAYEKLSKQQKKFFDGLREYAMKKDKCKEKRSTYNILLGQSTVNPLVKLTIKKDVTVALFKMEDEYLKDIRRNAGSDGTKVKVKETEVAIGDAQAYATAKEMIDLREDQIERYQDFLKEQRSMKNR